MVTYCWKSEASALFTNSPIVEAYRNVAMSEIVPDFT
jgi:hypothetical protein